MEDHGLSGNPSRLAALTSLGFHARAESVMTAVGSLAAATQQKDTLGRMHVGFLPSSSHTGFRQRKKDTQVHPCHFDV